MLLAAGAASAAARGWRSSRGDGPGRSLALLVPSLNLTSVTTASAAPVGLGALFLAFLKIGAMVFGSGYVLLAFLRADFVNRLGLALRVAVPRRRGRRAGDLWPVFTTATFIGYLVAGSRGAAVATIAIFLPRFVLVAAIRPLVAWVRQSAVAGAFLDGVSVASLSLMAVVTVQLGHAALVDAITILLAAASAVLLLRFR